MRDADRMQEKIEIALEQRQVALLALAALVLLGVVFAAGVQVGRQISSAQASAPQAAHPDDLVAIDDSHAEGTQGAAAKVEARQPPTRAQLEAEQKAKDAEAKAAEAKAAETKAAEAAIVPLAPAAGKVPESGKVEPGKVDPVKADADDDSNSDDDAEAPKPQKVAIVKQAPDAHATVKRPPEDEVHLTAAPASLGAYTVQIGASQEKKEAQRLESKARSAGLKPYSVEANLGAKGTWFRVRVGSFANKDVATRYQKDVERELRVSAMVMPTK